MKLEDTYSINIIPDCDLDQKRIKKDVDDLYNHRNEALSYSETNKNYHNLFGTFLSTFKNRKDFTPKENKQIIKAKYSPPIRKKEIIKKPEIKVEITPKLIGKTFIYLVQSSKKIEEIVSNDNEEKEEVHTMKKEKDILNNEIINLREKLNEIKEKTQEIKTKLEKPTNIENYKLLDKLIDGFTEALIVHWEDLVEAVIDDILIEEVKLLNRRERENKFSLNTFDDYASYVKDKTQHCEITKNIQPLEFFHIKQIYDEFLSEEKMIQIKHNLK